MKQNLKKINSFNKAIKKKRWAKRLISSFTLECPHACAWMNPRGAESTCVASYNQQPRFEEEQINHQHAFPLNSAMLSLPVTHRNGVAWNVMILQTTFFIFCSSSPLFPVDNYRKSANPLRAVHPAALLWHHSRCVLLAVQHLCSIADSTTSLLSQRIPPRHCIINYFFPLVLPSPSLPSFQQSVLLSIHPLRTLCPRRCYFCCYLTKKTSDYYFKIREERPSRDFENVFIWVSVMFLSFLLLSLSLARADCPPWCLCTFGVLPVRTH